MSSEDYRNDSRYRRYEAAVERNLATFETISEWADIIAFLSRLNKTLSSHPQFPVVPSKLIVCKRLAQCLNPNLPSGVHQKTLETYSVIFQKIGVNGLLHDISIYTGGLFSFFEHASSSIRMEYLDMITRFFVPLGPKLHLILQNLVLALVPGLEEEGNDCFAKTLSCLDSIAKVVGRPIIMCTMWKSMIFGGRHRLAVCNYIGKLYPREMSSHEFDEFCAGDPNLMLTGLKCSLSDQNTLAIRFALDIVRLHLPNYTDRLLRAQKSQIAQHLLLVLLRRDMSLTRRVYQWAFASPTQDPEDGEPSERLTRDSELVLIDAVKSLLRSSTHISDKVASRSFKVLIHLTDKIHIMESILGELTMDILEAVSLLDTKPVSSTTRTSATQLLNLVDLSKLWESVLQSCEKCPPASFEALSKIIIYGINHTSICAEEGGSLYGPIFIAKLFRHIRVNEGRRTLLPYCIDLFCALLPHFALDPSSRITPIDEAALDASSLTALVSAGINCNSCTAYAFEELLNLASRQASLCPDGLSDSSMLSLLGKMSLFLEIVHKLSKSLREIWRTPAFKDLVHSLHGLLKRVEEITLIHAVVRTLLDIRWPISANERADFVILPAVDDILSHFWKDPSHSNSPALIRELHEGHQSEVDSYLCRQMCVGSSVNRAAAITNVSKLWTSVGTLIYIQCLITGSHLYVVEMKECPTVFVPKSMMIFLESLDDPAPEVSRAALSWFNQIIGPLLDLLLEGLSTIEEPSLTFVPFYSRPYNADQICYSIQLLASMVQFGGPAIYEALNQQMLHQSAVERLISALPSKHRLVRSEDECPLILAGILAVIPFACAESMAQSSEDFRRKVENTQILAQNLLVDLLEILGPSDGTILNAIYAIFVDKLQYSLQIDSFAGQPLTIRVLDAILRRAPPPKLAGNATRPDPADLSQVISRIVRIAVAPEVLAAWSEFICSAASLAYFEDIISKLVEPQCRVLLGRMKDAGSLGSHSRTDVSHAIVSFLSEVFHVVLSHSEESTWASLRRRPSLRSSSKQSWAGIVATHSTGQPSQEKVLGEVKLNPISTLIPIFATGLIFLSEDPGIYTESRWFLDSLERLYLANPLTFIYTTVCSVGSQLDSESDKCLFLHSPMAKVMDFLSTAHFSDLVKHLAFVYRQYKENKGDYFSKLSLEAILQVLYYIVRSRIEGTGAPELLSLVSQISKDVGSYPARYRSSIYIVLDTSSSIILKYASATEEKRKLKEFFDTYYRLLEISISVASKSNDISVWINSDKTSDDANLLVSLAKDRPAAKTFLVIVESVIPNFEVLISDHDKSTTLLSSILGQLIIANLKPLMKSLAPGLLAMKGLESLSRQPNIGKLWKREFWEGIFLDTPFFCLNRPATFELVHHMTRFLASEGDKLSEVLGKIPSSGSSNLFISREVEALNRACMIRRLSFVAFCMDAESLKYSMPSIQEKVVDLFRLGTGLSSAEVFMLLRVLLIKLGDDMPSTIWPVVVTEAHSILESLLKVPGPDRIPGALFATVVQLCRLIDMVFIMGQSSSMLYFWMLVGNGRSDQFLDTPDDSTSPVAKIICKFQWKVDKQAEFLTSSVLNRRSLIPDGKVLAPDDLKNFFLGITMRTAEVSGYAESIDFQLFKDELISCFTEPIRDATQ